VGTTSTLFNHKVKLVIYTIIDSLGYMVR